MAAGSTARSSRRRRVRYTKCWMYSLETQLGSNTNISETLDELIQGGITGVYVGKSARLPSRGVNPAESAASRVADGQGADEALCQRF